MNLVVANLLHERYSSLAKSLGKEMDFTSNEFVEAKKWVLRERKEGQDWTRLKDFHVSSEFQILRQYNRWHKSLEDESKWISFLEFLKAEEELSQLKKRIKQAEEDEEVEVHADVESDSDVFIPENEGSAWQLYKKSLEWDEESKEELEQSVFGILKRLRKTTEKSDPVKGMVVGRVQSGKTSNFSGLMAMAADNGWNMFVILSGTITNLMDQTKNRIMKDLNRTGNLAWKTWDIRTDHLQHLDFGEISRDRHFLVSLKNYIWLDKLMSFLKSDQNRLKQAKIIVIDDEADQAGVNGRTLGAEDIIRERTRINGQLVDLVASDYLAQKMTPKCINYIGYTATPYANFLNEAYPESLYPKSFIRVLRPSKRYFGSKKIFGIEGHPEYSDGMPIINKIGQDDVRDLVEGEALPDSLREAIAWYLCSVAQVRLWGEYKNPVSMLIHTSHLVSDHIALDGKIRKWLTEEGKAIFELCRNVHHHQAKTFNARRFESLMPDYPNVKKIKEHSPFEDLMPQLSILLNQVTRIRIVDPEGNNHEFHDGIHLCVDNSRAQGLAIEDEMVRLVYPRDEQEIAPAFIVIGGNTLSRGLTLEGLVSSYFLRSSSYADSLMQMGRWFGYRQGYEVLPRLWMTDGTLGCFKYLTSLEYEMMETLREMEVNNISPAEAGPKLKAAPSGVSLQLSSRMAGAEYAEVDFSGTNSQTVLFKNSLEWLDENIKATERFLNSLGDSFRKSFSGRSIVWAGVDFERVKTFLLEFRFHERDRFNAQKSAFLEWHSKKREELGLEDWNIVASGNLEKDSSSSWELIEGNTVGKINRTRLPKDTHTDINIGVLRSPSDLLEDLPDVSENSLVKSPTNLWIRRQRNNQGQGLTPQLLIYRINKDSKADNEERRVDLSAQADLIGLSIWIPGSTARRRPETISYALNPLQFNGEGIGVTELSED